VATITGSFRAAAAASSPGSALGEEKSITTSAGSAQAARSWKTGKAALAGEAAVSTPATIWTSGLAEATAFRVAMAVFLVCSVMSYGYFMLAKDNSRQ
jgi:hypothetical protein